MTVMKSVLFVTIAFASTLAVDFHGVDISESCANGINGAVKQGIDLVPPLDNLATAAKGSEVESETAEISSLAHATLDLYNKYKDATIATGITKEEKEAAAQTFARFGKAKNDMADLVARTNLNPPTKTALDAYQAKKADLLGLRTGLLFKCATSLPALKSGFEKVAGENKV